LVTRKTEIPPIDGTPIKRMFWSIISDYDLITGLSELVDNAIDLWTQSGRASRLNVALSLDVERQLIKVQDDAGGVKRDSLNLLITPGGSRNEVADEVIGIFGVGGKRASIALGEHVEIRTRYGKEPACEIDITKQWLSVDDWEMPAYLIPDDFPPSTTSVEISHLRKPFNQHDVDRIREHIGATYSWFIKNGCYIEVNDHAISPKTFDHWAYPKDFGPTGIKLSISSSDGTVRATITAGLITDRDPELENYGVYVYCNHRLIIRELRSRDVGYFVTGEAGVPHPDASMCRAIVELEGPAGMMPWNSSKTGINPGHPIFQQLRPRLIELVSHFSSLSRRTKHDWEKGVASHTKGSLKLIEVKTEDLSRKLHLPTLPKVYKKPVEQVKTLNKKILKDAPWTVGLVEALAAVDILRRQGMDTKNRMALILLDSDFEIAMKEFIVHRHDLFPPSAYNDAKISQLFRNRSDVIREVTSKVAIPAGLLSKASHYYSLRNKLIHERATATVTDNDIDTYRDTVQSVLSLLFKLRF